MPSFPIQLKRNGTAAATPSSLLHGEVALNYADGKLFWKDASNVIQSFTFQAYALSSHTHAASDITSGTFDAARIANDSITYAKLQNVSATDRLLGRSSAGAGDVEEITCTAFGRSLIDDADAAAARTTLSVQPTASPAFTGTVSAAAANFTGAVSITSPLTLTGTVAGNVRQLKLQTSGVDRWQITPGFDSESGSNAGSTLWVTRWDDSGNFLGTPISIARATGIVTIESGVVGNGSATFNNTGNVVPLTVTNTGTANSFVVNDASGDTTPFVIDASGRVGIGTSSPGAELEVADSSSDNDVRINLRANSTALSQVGASSTQMFVDSGGARPFAVYTSSTLRFTVGSDGVSTFSGQLLVTAGSASACGVAFSGDVNTGLAQIGGADTASVVTAGVERVRVDASGNVGIGAAPGTTLDIQRASADAAVFVQGQTSSTGATVQMYSGAGIAYIGTRTNHPLVITTNNTERMRVDASGNVNIGTNNANPAGNNVAGVRIDQSGLLNISRNQDISAFFNRKGNDGAIIWLLQDGTVEGDISVAGNTISYNAFCGSHWAQLIDNSRPSILRGTVLETIDEMCEWPGEPQNDRLPRVKVSDTPGSRRVYGVFMAWDDEYASTGDLYATALGAYMVRVSGVVQSGDLLESAGDGTARTQPDDIVRSSTIGKVSSTHRVAEYDDGSYLVPCVLMCG